MNQKRNLAGILATVAGVVLMVPGLQAGVSASPRADVVATQTVYLNNDTASPGTADECPTDTKVAYWHFVIAPNNGTYTFVSMTLNLGSPYLVTGAMIIKNGLQTDNVFVAVPSGSVLTDLRLSGSSATITPDGETPNHFNLSHTCAGAQQETTSTEAATTSSEAATTSSEAATTSSEAATTSSEAATTSSGAATTSTGAATTSTIQSLVPIAPTTSNPDQVGNEAPAPAPDLTGSLPVTGATDTMWLEFGGFLVLLGITMLSLTRRRPA